MDTEQDNPRGIFRTALDLACSWGYDALRAGLDRDTLDTDREAMRAIRDAMHDDGHADAYTLSDDAIRAEWLDGFDVPVSPEHEEQAREFVRRVCAIEGSAILSDIGGYLAVHGSTEVDEWVSAYGYDTGHPFWVSMVAMVRAEFGA